MHVVPYVSCELEGELPPLDLSEDALLEVILEPQQELVVVHGCIAGQLSPKLGHLHGSGDLELEFVVRPLEEVCVIRRGG